MGENSNFKIQYFLNEEGNVDSFFAIQSICPRSFRNNHQIFYKVNLVFHRYFKSSFSRQKLLKSKKQKHTIVGNWQIC